MRWSRRSSRTDRSGGLAEGEASGHDPGATTQVLPRPRGAPAEETGASWQGWGAPTSAGSSPGFAPGAPSPEHRTEPHNRHHDGHSGHDTQHLDPWLAGAAADPFRETTVLRPPRADEDQASRPPLAPLSRSGAAEIGLYCGAALILVAVLGVTLAQWGDWDGVERLTAVGLTVIALVGGGAWLRIPWSAEPTPEAHRAVSALITSGVLAGGVGSALLFGLGQSSDLLAAGGHAVVAVLLLLMVNAAARTAYSETALLGAVSWLVWVAMPGGLGLWLGLAAAGAGWAAAGLRVARGRRTAVTAGAAVMLAAGTALAAQPDAWIARGALAAVVAAGLTGFLTGRANYWLALGAAAGCALAAGTAMDALSPAPALFAGGAATMVLSGIAMRAAHREAGVQVGVPSD